ncbi:hypothetical protein ACLOJK_000588 [Asimina triloba]
MENESSSSIASGWAPPDRRPVVTLQIRWPATIQQHIRSSNKHMVAAQCIQLQQHRPLKQHRKAQFQAEAPSSSLAWQTSAALLPQKSKHWPSASHGNHDQQSIMMLNCRTDQRSMAWQMRHRIEESRRQQGEIEDREDNPPIAHRADCGGEIELKAGVERRSFGQGDGE